MIGVWRARMFGKGRHSSYLQLSGDTCTDNDIGGGGGGGAVCPGHEILAIIEPH